MPKSPTCAFCSKPLRGQKSKEHIFPQWLQRQLGLKNQQLFNTLYTESGDISCIRQHTFNRHVSGSICESCNSGWLSDLEKLSRPLLIPLIDGTFAGTIDREESQRIARWLFKTALTLHLASQIERVIPAKHYQAIYERRAIPKRIVIAIANFQGRDELFWIQNQNWGGKTESKSLEELKASFKQTYRVILRAGHLAARIHYWPLDKWHLFDYAESSVRCVYPVQPNGVSWPPIDSISDIHDLDQSLFIIENQGQSK